MRMCSLRQVLLAAASAVVAFLTFSLWQAYPALAEVRNPHGVAVIVGNADYEHRDIPDVLFAHRDADAFRRYVVDVLGFDPENIIDLRDARRRRMFDALGSRRSPQGELWSYLDPDGGSDVVVFYSGHGVPGMKDKRGYLLPVDGSPHAAEEDGYPIDLLYKNLGSLKEARSVVIYLDACFSGSSAGGNLTRSASPIYVRAALPKELSKKVTALTAASGKQLASWDDRARHGLFTHHLLDALYGKGDADKDGRVTAKEAKKYLDKRMTRAARRQHRRIQHANLSGAEGVLLSVAVSGGFPERPPLNGGTKASKKEKKKVKEKVAKVVKPPVVGKEPTPVRKTKREKADAPVEVGEKPKVAVGIFPKPVVKPRRAPGTVFRDCPECPEMVVVPAGSFMMGSPPSEKDRNDDEGPRHQVTIPKSFAVGKYEVTVEEYRRFAKATDRGGSDGCYVFDYHGNWPWRFKDTLASWQSPGFVQTDRHPVVCVSRKNASAYVRWLSQKTDKQYRLLSETEWEYVARAGTSTRYSWGEGVGRKRANCDGCGSRWDGRGTAPVGSFQANGFGVHDMHGNAWEWVEHCRDYGHGGAPSGGRAHMNRDCAESRFRGGSWLDEPSYIRSACRSSLYVTYSYFSYVVGDGNFAIGLRIARTLAP